MLNVFIVDASEAMRESPRFMLSEFHDIRLVGHAADEAVAIEQINVLFPDVVILDLNLQPGTGVAVLKNIKKHRGKIKVMAFTDGNVEPYVDACKHANVDYLFDKSIQFMEVNKVFSYPDRTSQLNKKFDSKPANQHGKFWKHGYISI
jgi:DNA-binding NarL/FixJ family response regulator